MQAPNSKAANWRPEVWYDHDGRPLACKDKLKVLEETLSQLSEEAQDAFEDGLLMGCDEAQLRAVMARVLESLENPYSSS